MRNVGANEFTDRVQKLMPALVRGMMKHDENDITRGVVSAPQFWALCDLREKGPCSVNDLSRALGLQPSSTSGLVDRLAKLGMARRHRSRQDRRVVMVLLTPRGEEVVRNVMAGKQNSHRIFFKSLTPRERTQYVRILDKLVKALRETPGASS